MKEPIVFFILILTLMITDTTRVHAQEKSTYMRIAKITVDSTMLDAYTAALKEQMNAAIANEKGVLAYTAVHDKQNPSRITIFETYASVDAYKAHILTEHFKKYKATVANMVKKLELTDVVPIGIQSKLK